MGWFNLKKRVVQLSIVIASLVSIIQSKSAEAFTPRTAKAVVELSAAFKKIETSKTTEFTKGVMIARRLQTLYDSVKRDFNELQNKLTSSPESVSQEEINDVLQAISLMRDLNNGLDKFDTRARDSILVTMAAALPTTEELNELRQKATLMAARAEARKKTETILIQKEEIINRHNAEIAIKNQAARQLGIKTTAILNLQFNHAVWDSTKRGDFFKVRVSYFK